MAIRLYHVDHTGQAYLPCSRVRCESKVLLINHEGKAVYAEGAIIVNNVHPFCTYRCLSLWAGEISRRRGEREDLAR